MATDIYHLIKARIYQSMHIVSSERTIQTLKYLAGVQTFTEMLGWLGNCFIEILRFQNKLLIGAD